MSADGYDPVTGEVESALGAEGSRDVAPEIAAAIIAVTKQVGRLGNDDRNPHGGYGYVSVDKMYERIGPLMAEAGIALLIDETEHEIRASDKSGNPWLFAKYELRFLHASGVLGPRLRRSLALPISGPQAFGSAQSYVEKQFLRQVFKVPTGERDADTTSETNDAPLRQAPVPPDPAHAPAFSLAPMTGDTPVMADAKKRLREIRDEMGREKTPEGLTALAKSLAWKAMEEKVELALPPDRAKTVIAWMRARAETNLAKLVDMQQNTETVQ
jgi:hypothetical protein